MKKVKNILQITLIGLAVFLSTTVFGQKHHPVHRHHSILSMMEELELTDDQTAKITAIQEKYKEQMEAIKEKETEDREAKHQAFKALFEAQADEIHAVLTDEQMAKLEAKKAERQKAREEHKQQRQNIDRKGLKEAIKSYHEQNVLPVMKAQRAKLEDKIEAEDKVVITELREKFENVHKRMEKERKEQGERTKEGKPHKRGENLKGFRNDENPERERLHQLVEKYNDDIEALFEEIEPQQQKWHEDIKKIAEQYLPKPEGDQANEGHPHKMYPRPGMKGMRKGHFLLLDPNAPVESTTVEEPALAEINVYPNPATSANTLQYNVKQAGQVRIELRTKGGNVLRVLLNEYKEVGEYTLNVNLSDLESGIYFYTLIDQQGVTSRKVVVSK